MVCVTVSSHFYPTTTLWGRLEGGERMTSSSCTTEQGLESVSPRCNSGALTTALYSLSSSRLVDRRRPYLAGTYLHSTKHYYETSLKSDFCLFIREVLCWFISYYLLDNRDYVIPKGPPPLLWKEKWLNKMWVINKALYFSGNSQHRQKHKSSTKVVQRGINMASVNPDIPLVDNL